MVCRRWRRSTSKSRCRFRQLDTPYDLLLSLICRTLKRLGILGIRNGGLGRLQRLVRHLNRLSAPSKGTKADMHPVIPFAQIDARRRKPIVSTACSISRRGLAKETCLLLIGFNTFEPFLLYHCARVLMNENVTIPHGVDSNTTKRGFYPGSRSEH